MGQKIISVSISEGDKLFMRNKFLSPSKLLQERITQIRDEENPALKKQIKFIEDRNYNLNKKIEYMSDKMAKMFQILENQLDENTFNDIIKNI